MKKIKRIIVLTMATTLLLGATLTVNAATPRNAWCHPGAADVAVSGVHNHGPGTAVHSWTGMKCLACGNIKYDCGY